MYKYNNNINDWEKIGKINGKPGGCFGFGMSLNNNGMIVSIGEVAVDADNTYNANGIIIVYGYDGNNWNQIGNIMSGDNPYDLFSNTLSLNSDGTIVAGSAIGYNNVPYVKVYKYINNNWNQMGSNILGDNIPDTFFYGISLNFKGDIIALGAPYYSDYSGKVYTYKYNKNMEWNLFGEIKGKLNKNELGCSLSLNSLGNILAIGCVGSTARSCRMYEYNNTWEQIGNDIKNNNNNNSEFGYTVSLNFNGKIVAVSDPTVEEIGLVSIYQNESIPPPEPPLPPISNICFLGNTDILTDQGIFLIKDINPNLHTINNEKIIAITKTVTLDKYLICFEKNSLGKNYPNKKTIVSKYHKIFYNNNMIEAYKFENVHKVNYNGEILFNILLNKYSKIYANNLICESLHPENLIAKLYKKKLENKNIVKEINNCILSKNYKNYKKYIKIIKNI